MCALGHSYCAVPEGSMYLIPPSPNPPIITSAPLAFLMNLSTAFLSCLENLLQTFRRILISPLGWGMGREIACPLACLEIASPPSGRPCPSAPQDGDCVPFHCVSLFL